MKSNKLIKTVLCWGILLWLSGISQCQRAAVTRLPATRMRGGPVRPRTPTSRLRNTELSNQTSRRGTPRLLGFIIPSATGGRPRLRLMPGAQDFIGPGRRIAAAPLAQLQRLGGDRSRTSPRRMGVPTSRTMTGIPSSLLRRQQTQQGLRGQTRGGQIRRLPQNARNLINAARRSSAAQGTRRPGNGATIRSGIGSTRQPNIVVVRPQTRNRAVGLTPELIQRIRQTALRRAAARRAAAASGRPVSRILPPSSQIRMLNLPQSRNGQGNVRPREAAIRRRMNALNTARPRGSAAPIPTSPVRREPQLTQRGTVPPRQAGPVRQEPQPTVQINTNVPRPTRVDEAVLRANVMPAGIGGVSDSVRTVVTSSSTSSETSSSSVSKSSSSSESSVLTSGSSSDGTVGVIQGSVPSSNPVTSIIGPDDVRFRTTVDGAPVVAPDTVGISGISPAVPTLETGPPFQIVSGDVGTNSVIKPRGDASNAVSLDIGAAAGPALVVNPTVVDQWGSAASLDNAIPSAVGLGNVAPVDDTAILQGGSTIPMEDPTLVAAAAVGPSLPFGITGQTQSVQNSPDLSAVSSTGSIGEPLGKIGGGLGNVQLQDLRAVLPDIGLGRTGMGEIATPIDTRIPDMAASSANTNDGTNSLKSMIVDVLRDMAGKGTSSNTQPDISAVAQAILQAQRKKDTALSETGTAGMNTKATDINVNTPVHQQTFTLPPHSPTVFSNISPLQTILKGAPSTLSPLSDMFHATGTGSTLFDTNLSTTSNNALGDGTVSKSSSITGTPRDISMIADANPTSLGTFQTKRPTDFTTNLLTASMKETTRGIPFNATSTSKPSLHLHTGSPESTAHLHTPKVTVTTVSPQTVTNDRLNLIVGDWTGADQHLTQPPKPSPVVDHTHDHNHVHSHVHGFTEPAIPRPPPLPTDAISNNGISGTTGSSSSLGFHSLKQNLESFGQNTAKESTGNTSNAAMGNVLGLNIADSTTGRSTKDMGLNIGPGDAQLSNMYLDINQIGHLLGLDTQSLTTPQDPAHLDNATAALPTNHVSSFLADLVAFMQDPSNSTDGHGMNNMTKNHGKRINKSGRHVNELHAPKQHDPVDTQGIPSTLSDLKGNVSDKPKVTDSTKTKIKHINASTAFDTSLDLKSSSSKKNETVTKKIRQINITTTITKKTKPVVANVKGQQRRSKLKKSPLGKATGSSFSETGIGNTVSETGIGNTVSDVRVGNRNIVGETGAGNTVSDFHIGNSVTGTGGSPSQSDLAFTNPERAGMRADTLDTLLDSLGGDGMELMMAMNALFPL